MTRDKLFLRPDFLDPAFPGKWNYCWRCALIEGVLTSLPKLARNLDIERVKWSRPRQPAMEMVGEANQSLPLLVLADGRTSNHQSGKLEGQAFINDKDHILSTLSKRHVFPLPHP